MRNCNFDNLRRAFLFSFASSSFKNPSRYIRHDTHVHVVLVLRSCFCLPFELFGKAEDKHFAVLEPQPPMRLEHSMN